MPHPRREAGNVQPVSKLCIFCGRSERLSNEHVFPDWLSRIGLDLTPVHHAAGRILGAPRQWTAPPFTATVRAVCGSCNNGWLSQLETAAKDVAVPLIRGRATSLALGDHAILSAWALKTALVGTLVFSDQQRANGYGLPDAEYRLLYRWRDRVSPPPECYFWIGRYGDTTRPWSLWATPIAIDMPGADPDIPSGYVITLIIGKLLIHGVRLHLASRSLQVQSAVGLTPIWPASDTIEWLDTTPLNDDAVDRMHRGGGIAVRTWKPGSDGIAQWVSVPVRHWTGIRRSERRGSMVEVPAPCGEHLIYYPGVLAAGSRIHEALHVFCGSCDCGIGYLAVSEPDGTHFRCEGSIAAIAAIYENLPWPELEVADEDGTFLYRKIPSINDLNKILSTIGG